MNIISFIKESENAKLPYKATEQAACSDIYSCECVNVEPGKVALVNTGLKVAHVPVGYKLEVYCRSGMAAKGYMVANGVGQIDSDYRGLLKVIVYNSTDKVLEITPGDRIAQLAIVKVEEVQYDWALTSEATGRGEGGFGSTGIR